MLVIILSYFGAIFLGLLAFFILLYFVIKNDTKQAKNPQFPMRTLKKNPENLDIIRTSSH